MLAPPRLALSRRRCSRSCAGRWGFGRWVRVAGFTAGTARERQNDLIRWRALNGATTATAMARVPVRAATLAAITRHLGAHRATLSRIASGHEHTTKTRCPIGKPNPCVCCAMFAAMRAIRQCSKSGGGRLVSWCMDERRRSVQVMVQRRLLVEGLPDLAYTHLAGVVWDMRKSSVFKRERFPDVQCWASEDIA